MRLSPRKSLSLLGSSISFNKPLHVQWMITDQCNYRCKSCNVWRRRRREKELSTEEVKAGVDVLRKMGVLEVVLSGGNPLLRNDIGEIIDYASRYLITTIYDNGSQVKNKIDVLRKADFVAISLDTLDEKKYDYLKGVPGAWKRALGAIQTLYDEGVSVAVSPTISQLNLHEILDFTDHFIEKGVPVIYCLYQHDSPSSPLFQIGNQDEELEITSGGSFARICDALIEKKNTTPGILITKKMLATLKTLYLTGQRTWECRALRSFFMIDPTGDVASCHLQKPLSTIFDLPRLWNSERFEKLRNVYRNCRECSYMCYLFYSLHSDVKGHIEVIRDQWKNARILLAR